MVSEAILKSSRIPFQSSEAITCAGVSGGPRHLEVVVRARLDVYVVTPPVSVDPSGHLHCTCLISKQFIMNSGHIINPI